MTTPRHVILGSGAIGLATLDALRRRGETAPLVNSANAADLVVLTELVESGKVTPVIDRTCPLEEAPAAIRRMQDGQVRGKLVVSVYPGSIHTPDSGSTT
jgi:NADPH:quinone reductase-like Zn-dependent oxidoreductase